MSGIDWLHRRRRRDVHRRAHPAVGAPVASEVLEQRLLLAAQVVTPDSATQTVNGGDSFSFDLMYSTVDPAAARYTGLALRMHYDSTQLTFGGLTNRLMTGLDEQQDFADTADIDGDAATDRFVLVLWFDIDGNWPNAVTQPARLYTAAFTAANDYTGTQINFTAESPADVDFQSTPVTVAEVSGSLDVDANGAADVFTDGILMARHLVGFTGQNLVRNAIGSGAARSAPADITTFLADSGEMLDPDGNGVREVFTDGILIARYLVGFTGQNLIRNAVGSGATRTTALQIIAFLNQFRPPAAGATAPAGAFAKGGPAVGVEPSAATGPVASVVPSGLSPEVFAAARDQSVSTDNRDRTPITTDRTPLVSDPARATTTTGDRPAGTVGATGSLFGRAATSPERTLQDEVIDIAFADFGTGLSVLSLG